MGVEVATGKYLVCGSPARGQLCTVLSHSLSLFSTLSLHCAAVLPLSELVDVFGFR